MRIFYNKAFKNYFLLTFTIFFIEVLFRVLAGLPVIDHYLIRVFIGANVIGFLFGLINSFFGRIAGDILNFCVSIVAVLYALAQLTYYNYFHYFFSLGTLSQLSVIEEQSSDIFMVFNPAWLILFIPSTLLLLFFSVVEKRTYILEQNDSIDFADKFNSPERKELNRKNAAKKKRKALIADRVSILVFTFISVAVYYFTINLTYINDPLDVKTPSELLNINDLPNLTMKQYGFTGFAFVDVKNHLKPGTLSASGIPYANEFEKPNQAINDFTRYIDDAPWEVAIENEKNQTYKALNNYYISQEITEKNDLTGLFKNKNLIIISMEAVNNAIINKDYFPNIYKLYNEGWSWDNAYTPRGICSQGNNELTTLTSLYTIKDSSCTVNNYANNKYHESLFSLFKSAKYDTKSYSNYTDKYYKRKTIYQNLGVDKHYTIEELGIPFKNQYGEWPSDIDMMEKVLDNIVPEEIFMTWISTSTTSEPYSMNSEFGDLHLADFKDTNYNIELKRYLSKLKVLDEAIGILMDGLEEKGILSDTVIVLYSNYTPYSLDAKTLNAYFDYDVSKNREIERTPFIIYNSEIIATNFTELTSNINILPTLANLFDLRSYDPRLYLGQDLFSKDYKERIIYSDYSWQDTKAFYDASTNKISYYSDTNKYSDEEIEKIKKEVKQTYLISDLTIRTDFFNHLNTAIEAQKVSALPEQ